MRFNVAVVVALVIHVAVVAGQVRFGRFTEPIEVRFVRGAANERLMELLNDVVYVAPDGKRWTAMKGYKTDGATIPQLLWGIVGGPFDGQYREAAVIHDYYCFTKSEPWQDVHRIFYYACRAAGVDELKAKILYSGVRYGGPKWNRGTPSNCYALCHAVLDGLSTDSRGREVYRAPMSQAEADSLARWVSSTNPSLEEIDAYIDKTYPLNRLGH